MISEFSGNHRWLSNFWLCQITMGDLVYPSTENAYQAAKYPSKDRQQFTTCSPSKAKRLGNMTTLPINWDSEKLIVMRKVLNQKFRANTFNAAILLETGDVPLIEGNTWDDCFWGVCNGQGQNHLGLMIMDIRTKLIDQQPKSAWRDMESAPKEMTVAEFEVSVAPESTHTMIFIKVEGEWIPATFIKYGGASTYLPVDRSPISYKRITSIIVPPLPGDPE